jgi:hypothetical protein
MTLQVFARKSDGRTLMPHRASLLAGFLLISACTADPPVTNSPYVATALTPVQRIAVAPGGGSLSDTVAAVLETTYGFEIVPAETVSAMMAAAGVAMLDGPQLGGLGFLGAQGIDAVLTARGEAASRGTHGAAVAILRVPDGARLAESHWTPRFGILSDIDGTLRAGSISGLLAQEVAMALRR